MIAKIIYKNIRFYWQKVALTIGLVALLLFLVGASLLFVNKIKGLADAPLDSLQTEIILQKDSADKQASAIKTRGVIEPFNLQSFAKRETLQELKSIKEIKEVSTALVLWQFDIQNNRTIVGLNVSDPDVGLRKVEHLLMPKGRFFTNNNAQEVILERHFAKLFGYKLNSVYKISGQDYKIVGIVDFKEQSNLANAQVFIPEQTALALIGKEKLIVNQVFVSLSNASKLGNAQKQIESVLPNFSVLTKDRLLKNLSSFNSLVYQFGNYFVLAIFAIVLFLIYWILKMNRMEFGNQTEILAMLGWSKKQVRTWIFLESVFIIIIALIASVILVVIFALFILPNVEVGALLNQNFKL